MCVGELSIVKFFIARQGFEFKRLCVVSVCCSPMVNVTRYEVRRVSTLL